MINKGLLTVEADITTGCVSEIASYMGVTDTRLFTRGQYDLKIHLHKPLQIVYEIREYHDVTECRAHLFRNGKRIYAECVATNDFIKQAPFDVHGHLMEEVTRRITGLMV